MYLKKYILKNLKPIDAYSLHVLDSLTPLEILTLVDEWLTIGIESKSIFELYSGDHTNYNNINSLFIQVFEELNLLKPNQYEASKHTIRIIFQKMINNDVELEIADNLVYNIESSLECTIFEKKEKNYKGAILNLEKYMMWNRELSDCIDGSTIFYYTELPRDKACEEIKKEILSEAIEWLKIN